MKNLKIAKKCLKKIGCFLRIAAGQRHKTEK